MVVRNGGVCGQKQVSFVNPFAKSVVLESLGTGKTRPLKIGFSPLPPGAARHSV